MLVDSIVIDDADGFDHLIVRHECLVNLLAFLLRHLLAVVDGLDDEVLGEDARGGDDGAREGTAPGFVHAADELLTCKQNTPSG